MRSGTIVGITAGLRRLSASVSPSKPGTTCRSRVPLSARGNWDAMSVGAESRSGLGFASSTIEAASNRAVQATATTLR